LAEKLFCLSVVSESGFDGVGERAEIKSFAEFGNSDVPFAVMLVPIDAFISGARFV